MLPETGYLRLWQIIGDRKKNITPLIPVSKTMWYEGIKTGKYPAPKALGPRTSGWRVEEIRALIQEMAA